MLSKDAVRTKVLHDLALESMHSLLISLQIHLEFFTTAYFL